MTVNNRYWNCFGEDWKIFKFSQIILVSVCCLFVTQISWFLGDFFILNQFTKGATKMISQVLYPISLSPNIFTAVKMFLKYFHSLISSVMTFPFPLSIQTFIHEGFVSESLSVVFWYSRCSKYDKISTKIS